MKIKNRFVNTFVIGVIIGIATHMYRLTNWMLCEDSTNYLDTISKSWVTSVGRYLLPYVENVRGTYELSWLLGLIGILCLSLAAGIIVEMFDVRGNISKLLVAWIVVANPIVTSTFAYMYTADGYFFGLMLGVLATYLINRSETKKKKLLGTLLLAASLAFYQAFLTVVIMLILIEIMLVLLDQNKTMKDVGAAIARNLIWGLAGVVLYLIGLKISWDAGGYGVTTYMGIGTKTDTGIIKYWYAVIDSYVDFARVFLVRWKFTSYNVMNVLMFALSAGLIIVTITKNKLWKKPVRWLLVGVIILALPIATHIFEFASEEVAYTTTIMDYGTMMVFLIPIVLFEGLATYKGSFSEWKEKAFIKKHPVWVLGASLMILICSNFTVIANKAYYNMFLANKNCELLINRVETRMEMIPGYHEDMGIMIVGSRYQIPEYVDSAPMMSGVVSNIFLTTEGPYVCYMNKMLSTGYHRLGEDRRKEIAQTEEFKSMPEWPADGSVKIIDGVMVVVLSYNDIDELYE